MGALILAQAPATGGNPLLQAVVALVILANFAAIVVLYLCSTSRAIDSPTQKRGSIAGAFLKYEVLLFGAVVMLLPFYWMIVTAFKDGQTAAAFPPVWTPSRIATKAPDPKTGEMIRVVPLGTAQRTGEQVRVVPYDNMVFRRVQESDFSVTKEIPDPDFVFLSDPALFQTDSVISLDLKNFRRAWYRPEESSRGQVNFQTYFAVSIISSLLATVGTLITSALAAFAFARLVFWGKTYLFYIVLATMMVPGQVLLIPNFLILSSIGWLDTWAALVVPWLASVFTIFLMRQFFMTIPEDLWDAARIDGASRFRYLWQVVVPLSRPVFVTAGIFDFLNNWNSLLWPLIVTSTPRMRTLMVGLQNLNDDAGAEFHILMAASCFAVLPVVLVFFFLQRFFIEGIARTGLK